MAWTQRASDTFTDTDLTAITSHTPDTGGGSWSILGTGTWRVFTNKLNIASFGGDNTAVLLSNVLGNIQAAECLDVSDGAVYFGPMVRANSSRNGYAFLGLPGSNDLRIQRLDAGVRSNLATVTASPGLSGATLRIEANSNTITVLVNGTSQTSATDGTYSGSSDTPATSQAGICTLGNNTTLADTFKAFDDAGAAAASLVFAPARYLQPLLAQ